MVTVTVRGNDPSYPVIGGMESQVEKSMEFEMKTGIIYIWAYKLYRVNGCPKLGVAFWGSQYCPDYSIWGSMLGSPYFWLWIKVSF